MPALVLLGGLPMELAVGTSLVVIAMKSFAGLAGHLGHVDIDWRITLAVTAVAVLGSFVGGRLAGRIPGDVLRRAFGVFVLLLGLTVFRSVEAKAAPPDPSVPVQISGEASR